MGGPDRQRQQRQAPAPDTATGADVGGEQGDAVAWDLQHLLGNQALTSVLGMFGGGAFAAPDGGGGGGGGAAAAAPAFDPTDEDIAWIAGLSDTYVREQIDGAFSEDAVRKAVTRTHRRKRGETKEERQAAIDAEVERRMGQQARAKKPKGDAESLSGNAVFEGLDRRAGTVASRKDFVAIGVSLLGSVKAVQDWFGSISKADAPGGVWLHESARRRYEAARRDFQREHPGWDFEPSYVGFQTRHRQHARNSTGLLSHFLGLALDVVALDNPHLVNADERVLIETVGGRARPGGFAAGSSRMKFTKPDGTFYGRRDYSRFRSHIAAAGKATEAGEALPAEAARLVGPGLDAAYGGMRATEVEMQASLDRDGDGHADEVAELRAVAMRYWAARKEIFAARRALARAERDLRKVAPGKARRAVVEDAKRDFEEGKALRIARLEQEQEQERAAAEERGERPPKARKIRLSNRDVAADPELSELKARYDHLRKHRRKIGPEVYEAHPVYQGYVGRVDEAKRALDAIQGPIVADKDRLLAPWFEKFDQRIAGYDAAAAAGDPASLKALDKALGRLARAKSDKARDRALAQIRQDPTLQPLIDGLDGYDAVKGALGAARDRAAAAKDAAADREVVRRSRGKLDDLDWVFGAKDALTVRDPSGLQLAEHGILWQGESSPGHTRGVPSGDEDGSEIWMREFVRVMMRHGFAPGGEWTSADSMHFELVESMNRFAGKSITYGPMGKQGP